MSNLQPLQGEAAVKAIYNKLAANPWQIKCEAITTELGKNQRKFANLVNTGLVGNQMAYTKRLPNWDQMKIDLYNNPWFLPECGENDWDIDIWEKYMRKNIGRIAWYCLAYLLDSQKLQSLPVNLEFNFS